MKTPSQEQHIHTVTIDGSDYTITGGTIANAATEAWLQAGEPTCLVVVKSSFRTQPTRLIPEVTHSVNWRCLDSEEFRKNEKLCDISQEGE